MIEFSLREGDEASAFIELNKLLKATQLCSSGAMANQYITDGMVKLNGKVDTRKRAKIRRGDRVEIDKKVIQVV